MKQSKQKMFFSHPPGGLGIGYATCGGQFVSLHLPIPPCFPTLPPTDFKFSVCCYPIICMYIYKFFVEFAITVRLWQSAWHGYQWYAVRIIFLEDWFLTNHVITYHKLKCYVYLFYQSFQVLVCLPLAIGMVLPLYLVP